MRVLYFGSYSLNNPRNAILIKGLKQNGVEVLECNDHSRYFFVKCVRLIVKYIRYIGSFDVLVVGFSGQELMPLARMLTRKPIVFDVFTSHYMGYILDRKYFGPRSLRAKYYRFIDSFSCRLADIVLLDTQAHIKYFVREYGLPAGTFRKIWLGANTDVYKRAQTDTHAGPLRVLFWGNFIPLQGTDIIIRAAKLLEGQPVRFSLIGKGQMLESSKTLAHSLGVTTVEFTGHVTYEELIRLIGGADICLGVFNGGIKADVTIQNKIFETLAMGKPLITSATTAIRELLRDGENCILCTPADPRSLADAVLRLLRDSELRERIASQGYELFRRELTERKLGSTLLHILEELT